jgi:hypothetical protein
MRDTPRNGPEYVVAAELADYGPTLQDVRRNGGNPDKAMAAGHLWRLQVREGS